MNQKNAHKFQERMEITYEEFFRNVLRGKVQLARELEQALGHKKAFEIIGEAQKKMALSWVKRMKEQHSIESFEDFATIMKKVIQNPMRQQTTTLTIQKETPEKLAFTTTECLRARIFEEMEATDLGYLMFCHQDIAAAKAFHPKIKLTRTKNLMQGDEYCNHTYYWDRDDKEG